MSYVIHTIWSNGIICNSYNLIKLCELHMIPYGIICNSHNLIKLYELHMIPFDQIVWITYDNLIKLYELHMIPYDYIDLSTNMYGLHVITLYDAVLLHSFDDVHVWITHEYICIRLISLHRITFIPYDYVHSRLLYRDMTPSHIHRDMTHVSYT